MPDLYDILGVSRRASRKRIKAAYHKLAKGSHPDVNAGDKQAEQRFKEFNRAYETLSDPEARTAYDLAQRRERHRFWRAAATMAATFLLTVSLAPWAVLWWQSMATSPSGVGGPAPSVSGERAGVEPTDASPVQAARVPDRSQPARAELPGTSQDPKAQAAQADPDPPADRDRGGAPAGVAPPDSEGTQVDHAPVTAIPPRSEAAGVAMPQPVRESQIPTGRPLQVAAVAEMAAQSVAASAASSETSPAPEGPLPQAAPEQTSSVAQVARAALPEQAFPEAAAWARLEASDDLAALLDFIERYSETAQADQARLRLARLVGSSDDLPALLAFIDRLGAGPLAEAAGQRARVLQARGARTYLPLHMRPPASWATYQNARFGFALRYPEDVFPSGPEQGDEGTHVFVSRDGRALLRISSDMNRGGTTLAQYRRSMMQKRYEGAKYDYTPQQSTWFVLSGTLGAEMFYDRTTFSCDGRSMHGWQLVYPLDERAYYDPIVEAMHRSYKHGNGPDARCRQTTRRTTAVGEPLQDVDGPFVRQD